MENIENLLIRFNGTVEKNFEIDFDSIDETDLTCNARAISCSLEDRQSLIKLKNNIQQFGLLSKEIYITRGDFKFIVVAGLKRFKALKILKEEGFDISSLGYSFVLVSAPQNILKSISVSENVHQKSMHMYDKANYIMEVRNNSSCLEEAKMILSAVFNKDISEAMIRVYSSLVMVRPKIKEIITEDDKMTISLEIEKYLVEKERELKRQLSDKEEDKIIHILKNKSLKEIKKELKMLKKMKEDKNVLGTHSFSKDGLTIKFSTKNPLSNEKKKQIMNFVKAVISQGEKMLD